MHEKVQNNTIENRAKPRQAKPSQHKESKTSTSDIRPNKTGRRRAAEANSNDEVRAGSWEFQVQEGYFGCLLALRCGEVEYWAAVTITVAGRKKCVVKG